MTKISWWLYSIPFISAFIHWLTIRMALKLLFHPRQPKRILGFTLQGVFPKKPIHFEPTPEDRAEAAAMFDRPRAITRHELLDQICDGMNEPESSAEPFVPSAQDWADYREWSASLDSAPNRYAVSSLDRFAMISAEFDAYRGR